MAARQTIMPLHKSANHHPHHPHYHHQYRHHPHHYSQHSFIQLFTRVCLNSLSIMLVFASKIHENYSCWRMYDNFRRKCNQKSLRQMPCDDICVCVCVCVSGSVSYYFHLLPLRGRCLDCSFMLCSGTAGVTVCDVFLFVCL